MRSSHQFVRWLSSTAAARCLHVSVLQQRKQLRKPNLKYTKYKKNCVKIDNCEPE